MAKIRILVSLTTNENDYQIEQAQSAEQAANKLGVSAEIIYANNDAINQSTQILRAIQASPEDRPNAIVFEPVGGTALPQVARAAAAVDIGWAVLNRDANYIEFRSCGDWTHSGAAVCGTAAARGNGAVHPGSVGEFRREGTHPGNARDQAG